MDRAIRPRRQPRRISHSPSRRYEGWSERGKAPGKPALFCFTCILNRDTDSSAREVHGGDEDLRKGNYPQTRWHQKCRTLKAILCCSHTTDEKNQISLGSCRARFDCTVGAVLLFKWDLG